MNSNLGGVIEGFYGRPWTNAQRVDLFACMADWGLKTYFYAPKDDLKHRALWRETYTDAEIDAIGALIDECDKRRLMFVVGLSPGLDIGFSKTAELELIKRRFGQLIERGARHFALLFDDLPGEMSADDRAEFDSVAAAQSNVANQIFRWLRGQFPESRLLFCPTPYCDRMVGWQLGGADYLDVIGQQLDVAIDVLWTGPEIISETISPESIVALRDRIRRPPIIWDNLHANDYDSRRLYCGPYSGRSPEMLQHVRGILVNPNSEHAINYVPLRTLASFLADPEAYDPRAAYLAALPDWLAKYETISTPIDLDDLRLLLDAFYLPFVEGPEAERLIDVVVKLIDSPVEQWGGAHEEFLRDYGRVLRVFEGLTELKDRELFYAWSRRVWDLREELELIKEFLDRKQRGQGTTKIASETHLPKTYRGGMVARLQRKISMNQNGLFSAAGDG